MSVTGFNRRRRTVEASIVAEVVEAIETVEAIPEVENCDIEENVKETKKAPRK